MNKLDIALTSKIIIIMTVAFLLITSGVQLLNRLVLKIFRLNDQSLWSLLLITLISMILFFATLNFFKINAHDIFGIEKISYKILTKNKNNSY